MSTTSHAESISPHIGAIDWTGKKHNLDGGS